MGARQSTSFYGEEEHRAVKDFVVEVTAALAKANGLLRRHALPEVDDPVSTRGMLAFLRKAQAAMQRQRGAAARRPA